MNLTFIGGGNMATALIGGLLEKGWSRTGFCVVDTAPEARAALSARCGIQAIAALPADLGPADAVVLAVKPQYLQAVARQLAPALGGRLVLTIAAGIRTIDLSRWLGGHRRIVRAMPNTPALVLAGVTALYAMSGTSDADRLDAEHVLGAVGGTVWVEREELLDAVTAVSGSGPAYVFYFMEAVEQAAEELGLDPQDARLLVLDTFFGAALLARKEAEAPAVLRARVTSRAGTTERALVAMEDATVKARVIAAVKQAALRSRELGDELGRDT